MKLIIQIPCLNEAQTLPDVLRDLPAHVDGIDCVEVQVIDDGSTDGTAEVAASLGVTRVIRLNHTMGLANAFREGVECALLHDVDILINTDGDNQYCGADIAKLVKTMLQEDCDMVIGCRPIKNHNEFSWIKKCLQQVGSWVVRKASKTTVPDAASGFRAYSRKALLRLNIVSSFSYCLETIIQAGNANMKIANVPIRVNPKTRESRLFTNVFQYIWKQAWTIVNMYILYRTGQFFRTITLLVLFPALIMGGRIGYFITQGISLNPYLFSVILSVALVTIAVVVYCSGILASLFVAQRKITEEANYHLRCLNLMDRSMLPAKARDDS